MAFPKIIIHRDVKPMHVFLDSNWTVNLSDLSFSISLLEGKTRIEAERIIGTFGYLDPLYRCVQLWDLFVGFPSLVLMEILKVFLAM